MAYISFTITRGLSEFKSVEVKDFCCKQIKLQNIVQFICLFQIKHCYTLHQMLDSNLHDHANELMVHSQSLYVLQLSSTVVQKIYKMGFQFSEIYSFPVLLRRKSTKWVFSFKRFTVFQYCCVENIQDRFSVSRDFPSEIGLE